MTDITPEHSSGAAAAIEDTIYLRNLRLSAIVGPDAWGRTGKSQPVVICIQLHLDTSQTGISDDLQHSFSYGQMCKVITSTVDGNNFGDIDHLTSELGKAAQLWPGKTIHGQVMLPKALLRVDGGFGKDFVLAKQPLGEWMVPVHRWVIKGIKAACIIGVNAHERLEKQAVNIDVSVSGKELVQGFLTNEQWRALVKQVLEVRDDTLTTSIGHIIKKVYRSLKLPRSRHSRRWPHSSLEPVWKPVSYHGLR